MCVQRLGTQIDTPTSKLTIKQADQQKKNLKKIVINDQDFGSQFGLEVEGEGVF